VLGASAVQVGTLYLYSKEANINHIHGGWLESAADDATAITNIFSGRPARGFVNEIVRLLGPISYHAPPFPTAGIDLKPLQQHAESCGRANYSMMWSGQAASLYPKRRKAEKLDCFTETAFDITQRLGTEAHQIFQDIANNQDDDE